MARRDPVTLEVLGLLAEMTTRFYAEYENAAALHDLSGVQAKLLAVVADGPVAMSRIASRLYCEPSNVTGLVDRLESRGLVTRQVDSNDRRVKLIAPTPIGAELAGKVWADLGFAAEPLAGLDDAEREALRDLLRKMRV